MPQSPDHPADYEPIIGSRAQSSRRIVLRGLWASLAGLGAAAASATLTACGGSSPARTTAAANGAPVSAPPAPSPPAPVPHAPTPPAPTPSPSGAAVLGAHNLVYNRDGVTKAPLATASMGTRATGSTILACVGRGLVSAHSRPTDDRGNVYVQTGTSHAYTLWSGSGTALYTCEQAVGGTGHVVTVAKPSPADETTLSVVEVVNGGVLGEVKWNEVLAGSPLTSLSVTTTGPAVLVAWWWGDADVHLNKTAVPDNGFTVIESILLEGALVQCAVAVRQVSAAGTYNVTWSATPAQGAQLWIAAVQSSG